MKCKNCESENLDDATFCEGCGLPLTASKCSRCGIELEGGEKFCKECGAKVKPAFPERTCPKCHSTWTPRKANPVNCPRCGFRLDRKIEEEEWNLPYVYDEGAAGFLSAVCKDCGKMTRFYAEYRTPSETERRVRCYKCIMKEWIEVLKGQTDMIPDSFETDDIPIDELEKALRK